MPTYRVTGLELSGAKRQAVAEAITSTHGRITGAPAFFAQVIFEPRSAEDLFIGGRPLGHPHLFVHGFIRGGRTDAQRAELIEALCLDVARAAELERRAVWVYLSELDATRMIEFGEVLPPDGAEAGWMKNLAPELRSWMVSLAQDPESD